MNRLAEILALLADGANALSTEEIEALDTELRQIYTDLRAEAVTADTLAGLQSVVSSLEVLATETVARETAQAELDAAAAELDARLAPVAEDPQPGEGDEPADPPAETDPPAEDPPAGDPPVEVEVEVEAVVEPERELVSVAAAGAPAPTPLANIRQRTPIAARPRPAAPARARVFATANVPDITAGGEFDSAEQLASALISVWDANANAQGGDGVKVPVARVQAEYPESRRLRGSNSAWQNGEIMSLALAEFDNAVTAAGGICAPTVPYYEQAMISHSSRPVRDGLTNFNADRGGINWIAPPTLASISTSGGSAAVGQVTAAQDAASATKTHQTVTCGTPDSAQIYAVTEILEFGNMMQRTFPELVRAWVSLAEAAWARFAENLLLTAIATGSTSVTSQQRLGAARDLLNNATLAAVAFRNRHRMPINANLVAMFPAWVVGMIQTDIFSAFNTGDDEAASVTQAVIESWFASRNIRVIWFEDGVGPGSPAQQIFPAQAAGALNGWPTVVQWYLFHEGAWLFLDGGTLDLGIVRDSTLNAANKYQMFMESFENVVKVGIESLRIRSTICANGATAGTITPSTICTGGS